jgi:hypothetical protein
VHPSPPHLPPQSSHNQQWQNHDNNQWQRHDNQQWQGRNQYDNSQQWQVRRAACAGALCARQV